MSVSDRSVWRTTPRYTHEWIVQDAQQGRDKILNDRSQVNFVKLLLDHLCDDPHRALHAFRRLGAEKLYELRQEVRVLLRPVETSDG